MSNQLFYQVQCLTEKSKPISGQYILRNWFKKSDRRYIAEALQKFIVYNRELFDYLDITPVIEGSGSEWELITEAQVHFTDWMFLKFNNAFGVTASAKNWAPEFGLMFSIH